MVNQTGRESKETEKSEVIAIGKRKDSGRTWEQAMENQQTWVKEINEKFPDLVEWLNEIIKWKTELFNYVFIRSLYLDNDDRWAIKLRLYTDEHIYAIVAYLGNENKRSYLGCTLNTRKARVGEEWNRGRDLPDGDYSEKTWEAIKNSIISYEIKKLDIQWTGFKKEKNE